MKETKPAAVTVKRCNDVDGEPYDTMKEIIGDQYPHLVDTGIVLMWKSGWKADADTGRVRLWKTNKADATIRAIDDEVELIIYLNEEIWGSPQCTDAHRKFILDSALREIQPEYDKDGDQRVDEWERRMWRIIKPTINTFPDIIERHGFVSTELQRLCEIAHQHDINERPLFAGLDDDASEPTAEEVHA